MPNAVGMRSESALPVSTEELAWRVVGRTRSLFEPDLAGFAEQIHAAVTDKRLLVIGGAGSIGSATVHTLLRYRPAVLDIVDINENTLAEVIRDIRSTHAAPLSMVRALPLDFGSSLMTGWLQAEPGYDVVMNFAAVKHVRSEKNVFSILHMFDVNVLRAARLLEVLQQVDFSGRYFCVSTDKAADPVNLMGASKRLMEQAVFALAPQEITSNSARFANVAFSNGSLLESFLRRLEKRQPLAAPDATRRFFLTAAEAGELCTLAALAPPPGSILVPALSAVHEIELNHIAEQVLAAHGFMPSYYDNLASALSGYVADVANGRYPLLRTMLDTSGEKAGETFVGRSERAVDFGYSLQLVTPAPVSGAEVRMLIGRLEHALLQPGEVRKSELVAWIQEVIPEFRHLDTGKNLDERA